MWPNAFSGLFGAREQIRSLRELSIPKLIHWLKRKGRFTNALHVGTLEALFNDLRRALPKVLCKQKRKRRTSRQLLEDYGYDMEGALAAWRKRQSDGEAGREV